MEFKNAYEDKTRAASYAKLQFSGTYYLAFRDLPDLIAEQVKGRTALDFGCGTGWIIFDGTKNEYRIVVSTEEVGDEWGCHLGGDCLIAYDDAVLWGYFAVCDQQSGITWGDGNWALPGGGQDYQTVTRWNSESDRMRIFFFNSRDNNWQSEEVAEHHAADRIASAHYYMYSAGPENNVVYYSSPLNQVIMIDLPDEDNVNKEINGILADAAGPNVSVLFNGATGNTPTFNFNVGTFGRLKTNSAIMWSNGMLYSYNPITETVVSHAYTENENYCADTGYIGIVAVYYHGNYYNKIYTYNALADNWIELIPTGTHSSILVGTKTALISRTQGGTSPDYVYAFDPQREVVGIDNDRNTRNSALPGQFELSQNYPNPFNAVTLIRYELPRPSQVLIEIYDILGRRVTALVNEEQPAGNYQAAWRADSVSSGIYYYRIQTGDFTKTKKMVVLK